MDERRETGNQLAGILGRLLAQDGPPAGSRGPKKGDLLAEYRDQILALKARGWTWDAIAREMKSGGFVVSAKTLRREVVGLFGSAKASAQKKRGAHPSPRKRTPASASAPASAEVAQHPAPGTVEKPKPPGTAAHFHTINEDEL